MSILERPLAPRPGPVSLGLPRLGFLGVGWIGQSRMAAIGESGKAEITAIADPSPTMREGARVSAPGAELVASLEELLELPLDGIVIATPSALHAQQAIAALERGIAVFCQKPLGRSHRETERVIDAARSADRLLGVDFSYRFVRAFQEVRNQVRQGAIGSVFAADLIFHNAYGPDKAWFYDPAQSGGGCVMDLGIHLLDFLLWTLDFPRCEGVHSRLFAEGRPLEQPGRVEDYAVARVDLEGGISANLSCSWKLPVGQDALISATFYGSAGGISVRNVGGSFYDFEAEIFAGTQRTPLVSPPDPWGGRAAVEWADRLAQDRRFDCAAERIADSAGIMDQIYRR